MEEIHINLSDGYKLEWRFIEQEINSKRDEKDKLTF